MKVGIGLAGLVVAIAVLVAFATGASRPAVKDSQTGGARLVSLRVEDFGSGVKRTEMGILVPETTSKKLLSVNEEASRIDIFADDKGGVLRGDKPLLNVGKVDGKSVLWVLSWKTPTAGAKELILRGQVAIDVAAHETDIRQRIDLKPGNELTSAVVDFRIKNVQNVSLDGVKMIVVIQSVEVPGAKKLALNSKRVSDVRFYGPDGNKIEYDRMVYKSESADGRITTEITYGFPRRMDSVVFGLTYVDKVEQITIPLDVRAGVGF